MFCYIVQSFNKYTNCLPISKLLLFLNLLQDNSSTTGFVILFFITFALVSCCLSSLYSVETNISHHSSLFLLMCWQLKLNRLQTHAKCVLLNRQKHYLSYMATIYCFLYVKNHERGYQIKNPFQFYLKLILSCNYKQILILYHAQKLLRL